MQQDAASPDMLDCAVQATQQEAVANLQAQITAAQEETAAKQASVLERETAVAELESRLSELHEKAAGLETAIGPPSAPRSVFAGDQFQKCVAAFDSAKRSCIVHYFGMVFL